MLQAVESNAKLRHAHMINITKQIMETGMSADYDVIQALSAKVYSIVESARQIRVTSPAGTDFTVRLNPNWKWIISDGAITPAQWKNLPDGEVFTCAETCEGRAVIDGCLGDYFGELGTCESFPVTVDMANGIVTQLVCPARPELEKDLNTYIHQDENAKRVGEFAIGTNIGLKNFIGNLLQDEKFPGVHIALGHGYPEKTGSPWHSDAHIDLVMRAVSIFVDGKAIMRDGTFLI
jgi:leucyl aminopeptidase (aminopeptidase T)